MRGQIMSDSPLYVLRATTRKSHAQGWLIHTSSANQGMPYNTPPSFWYAKKNVHGFNNMHSNLYPAFSIHKLPNIFLYCTCHQFFGSHLRVMKCTRMFSIMNYVSGFWFFTITKDAIQRQIGSHIFLSSYFELFRINF